MWLAVGDLESSTLGSQLLGDSVSWCGNVTLEEGGRELEPRYHNLQIANRMMEFGAMLMSGTDLPEDVGLGKVATMQSQAVSE